MRSTWQPWTNRRLHVLTANSAWLLHGVPGRGAQTARDAARAHAARTEEHARTQLHQRALSIFNELEIAQHPKRTAPNGSAPAVQPCRRRRTAPCRARSSASSLVQPDPTANAHHCKSHSASALNQPPAHRTAESTQLSTTASRPRPWATEGPSAADPRARDAERRARRHHKRRTRRQLPRQTGDASGR